MKQQPPTRKPNSNKTRSVLRETGKRHPVQVKATFVRLARQPGVIMA